MRKINRIIGIYKIINLINGKIYIGSSININRRLVRHKSELKNNVHDNEHLQNSYNFYGKKNFKFEVFEECFKENLILKEQYWIDFYQCYDENKGYNIRKKADNNLGVKWSKERIEKFSGENSPVSKLTWIKVNQIRNLYLTGNYSHKQLSEKYDVAESQIGFIINNKAWKDEKWDKYSLQIKNIANNTGEDCYNSKLSQIQVNEIRQKYLTGNYIPKQLAKEYNISSRHIWDIIKNNKWKDKEYEKNLPKIKDISFKNKRKHSGENSYLSKLNWDIVNEIRQLYSSGNFTQMNLADKYNVSEGCIAHILRNRSWKSS